MTRAPESAAELLARLWGDGFERLAACPSRRLERAWSDTLASLAERESEERRLLERELSGHIALTPPALSAALDVMLAGGAPEVAARVFARATPRRTASPALVVLSATPVGLAVQSLLPAIARRRPLVLKSARAEPRFTPFLIAALAARESVIGDGYAALTWEGGSDPIEETLAEGVDRVIVYGGAPANRALQQRWGERVFAHGPKLSVALVAGDGSHLGDPALLDLARDVALFEQQGCLSLQLVLAEREGRALCQRLASALEQIASELPPAPLDAAHGLEIQQLRSETEMRDLWISPGPIGRGSVLFGGRLGGEPALPLQPSPGGRTVIVWQVDSLELGVAALAPLRGHLQGAVLALSRSGAPADLLRSALRTLGVSRLATPGRLQHVDALWPNGGVDPLDLY